MIWSKSAVRNNYLSTVTPGTGVHGSFYAYRDVYPDLDPLYRDGSGAHSCGSRSTFTITR